MCRLMILYISVGVHRHRQHGVGRALDGVYSYIAPSRGDGFEPRRPNDMQV